MSLAFGIDFDDGRFSLMIRNFWLKRPGMRYVEPEWRLEPVLRLLGTRAFMAPLLKGEHLLMKCMFLLGLAMGSRVSEFASLLRGDRYIRFSSRMRSVTIIPNASFLMKTRHLNLEGIQ